MAIVPQLGKEYPQPGEEQDIEDIIDTIIQHLKKTYPPGKTLRQFHAKMHGFVEAVFTVEPDLPANVQYGFLQPGKAYKARIRFSNGNTQVFDDRKADLRGMAIKLLNVPGDMLVPDETMPQSQDILLVSYPTLMSPDVAGFKKNIRALCGGFPGMLRFGINPLNWPTLIRTLRSMKKTDNLFSQSYWSVSPSRLGTPDQAIKYSAVPATQPAVNHPEKTHPDFLRDVMQQELNTHDFRFHFLVQFQEDAISMPIENPCMEWKSDWHKVAEITIPKQLFNTAERNESGEHASYSPWHSLAEHQPLGGISRARKKAYGAISAFRSQYNQII
jgi:hypothetical protein